jgi:hypothetical protein
LFPEICLFRWLKYVNISYSFDINNFFAVRVRGGRMGRREGFEKERSAGDGAEEAEWAGENFCVAV